MTPPKIKAMSPLAVEYEEQKKLVAQNKITASSQKRAKSVTPPEDVVTLSSENPDSQNLSGKTEPSQPVTHEEKQALETEFSIHA
jgi:hypothetical protein